MSGAITRSPAAASAGATRSHVAAASMKPWTSKTTVARRHHSARSQIEDTDELEAVRPRDDEMLSVMRAKAIYCCVSARRDRTRSRSSRATASDRRSSTRRSGCSRPRGVKIDVGGPRRGRRGRRDARHDAPARGARGDPAEQGRAQGPDRDADRQGLPLGQRDLAADARSLRERAAGAEPARASSRASRAPTS